MVKREKGQCLTNWGLGPTWRLVGVENWCVEEMRRGMRFLQTSLSSVLRTEEVSNSKLCISYFKIWLEKVTKESQGHVWQPHELSSVVSVGFMPERANK